MSHSLILFEQLEPRLLLDGAVLPAGAVAGAQPNIPVVNVPAKAGATSAAAGSITTTDGYAAHTCKTDYGVRGVLTRAPHGVHALNWNAGGTWTGMDITNGTWWTDAKGELQVDFSAADAKGIVTHALGAISTYGTRPRVGKAKYKAASAGKAGKIAVKITFRTHTTVWDPKKEEFVEGHIAGGYVAKYNIPAAAPAPQDISSPVVGTIDVKTGAKDPATGKRLSLGKEATVGTVDWNKDGTFTYGGLIQDGTWSRDAKGKLVVNISQDDVQRILNNAMGGPGGVVTSVQGTSNKASVGTDAVGKLQFKIDAVLDIPGMSVTGAGLRIKMKLQGPSL